MVPSGQTVVAILGIGPVHFSAGQASGGVGWHRQVGQPVASGTYPYGQEFWQPTKSQVGGWGFGLHAQVGQAVAGSSTLPYSQKMSHTGGQSEGAGLHLQVGQPAASSTFPN